MPPSSPPPSAAWPPQLPTAALSALLGAEWDYAYTLTHTGDGAWERTAPTGTFQACTGLEPARFAASGYAPVRARTPYATDTEAAALDALLQGAETASHTTALRSDAETRWVQERWLVVARDGRRLELLALGRDTTPAQNNALRRRTLDHFDALRYTWDIPQTNAGLKTELQGGLASSISAFVCDHAWLMRLDAHSAADALLPHITMNWVGGPRPNVDLASIRDALLDQTRAFQGRTLGTPALPPAVRQLNDAFGGGSALVLRFELHAQTWLLGVGHRDIQTRDWIDHDHQQLALAALVLRNTLRRSKLRAERDAQLAQLNAVLRSTHDTTALVDLNGTLRSIVTNTPNAPESLAGAAPGDALRDLFSANIADTLIEHIHAAHATQQPQAHTFSVLHHSEQRWFDSRFAPLLEASASGTPRFAWALLDRTERAQLDARKRQEQKLESIGLLAGGVAHDFNNLLVAILGNAELAALDLPPQTSAARALGDITRAAQRAAAMCQQLLTFSGTRRTKTDIIDLGALVHDTHSLIRVTIPASARVVINLPDTLPPLEGDITQLQQVVLNLITNAIEALNPSGGIVRITASSVTLDADAVSTLNPPSAPPAPGAYCRLEISDTGAGMTPEVLARIFDPFFTTKPKGRGLGLASVRGLVLSHNGAITVTSAPDQGTTFRVYLPASNPALQRPAITNLSTTSRRLARMSRTIIIADDDDAIRIVCARILSRLGYTTHEAATNSALHDLLDTVTADAIILDVHLSDGHSGTLYNRIRAAHPDLPILLTSGYPLEDIRRELPDLTSDSFLPKPFTPSEMTRQLAALLKLDA